MYDYGFQHRVNIEFLAKSGVFKVYALTFESGELTGVKQAGDIISTQEEAEAKAKELEKELGCQHLSYSFSEVWE